MDVFIICLVAFLASILTFFSGFGLGTLLAPVMMIYLPVEVSIALTGVVHFFNNVFKLFLVGRKGDKKVILKFGLPAIFAAYLGAWLLLKMSNLDPIYQYHFLDQQWEIFPIKLVIAILLMAFALIDLLPWFSKLQFGERMLPAGGVLSGFFGGLTGTQGALRSAFLIKSSLNKEAFIGTTVVVSTLVDITRLGVYATGFSEVIQAEISVIIIGATISAIIGAILGNKLLKKVTFHSIQIIVAVFLILIAIGLGLGFL